MSISYHHIEEENHDEAGGGEIKFAWLGPAGHELVSSSVN
jgi:hypothetical protein